LKKDIEYAMYSSQSSYYTACVKCGLAVILSRPYNIVTLCCVMSESAEQTARHTEKSNAFDRVALHPGSKKAEYHLRVRHGHVRIFPSGAAFSRAGVVQAGPRVFKNRDDFTRL
jgi:hypothetical protein